MKNYITKIFLLLCIIPLIFTSCSKNPIQLLDDDITTSGSLCNFDLAGHTVFVGEGSTSLENLSNGRIYVQEDNQANTILLKNCQKIDVIVFSKSNIVLDSYTTINRLELNGNARITHLHNSKKKNQFPVIQKVMINSGIIPVLEDCSFMSVEIKENPLKLAEKVKEEIKPEVSIKQEKKLTLIQDKTYDGNGAKILISNIPEKAEAVEIYLSDYKNQKKYISFMKNTEYGENHEYFNLGYFIYPFLNAGKTYTFEFKYKLKDDSDEYIEEASVNVVPVKGEELFIKPMSKDNLVLDKETLTGYFKEKLESNIPSEANLHIRVWTSDWTYLGHKILDYSDKDSFGPYNFYKDIDYSFARKDLESINQVFITFSLEYECFSWLFYTSTEFPFSSSNL